MRISLLHKSIRGFRKNVSVSSILVVLAFVSSAWAQHETPAFDVPVFRSTSRLVILDVVVTDKTGKAVQGLAKDDFTVLEDRQPQRITQFEATTEHAVNHISNTPAPLTIFVLDELNTTYEEALYSRRSLLKYLHDQPDHLASPSMIVAVTNVDLRLLHDYTQDKKDLVKVLQSRQPEYPWKLMKGWVVDRLARCLVALQQIAVANAGYSVRKNVIWIGRGFPSINFSDENEDNQRITVLNAVNRTTARLLEARVTVYTIDPMMNASGSSAFLFETSDEGDLGTTNSVPDPWNADLAFGNFGPATGGKAFRSRNDINNEIRESVEDGTTYYTLAYVPTNHSDTLIYRRIRIKLRRTDLVARTRDGYYGAVVPPTDGVVALDMSQAAQNPFVYTGIQVTVVPCTTADSSTANCMVQVDPRGITWTSMDRGALHAVVEIAAAALSPESKILSYTVKKFGSTNLPEERSKLFQMPARFPITTNLPQGTQRVRFVVRDLSSGRIGTFDLNRSDLQSAKAAGR